MTGIEYGELRLGEGAAIDVPVVPEVSLVGETVADESEFALFGILEDRVEGLLLGDLHLGVGLL